MTGVIHTTDTSSLTSQTLFPCVGGHASQDYDTSIFVRNGTYLGDGNAYVHSMHINRVDSILYIQGHYTYTQQVFFSTYYYTSPSLLLASHLSTGHT